MDWQENLKRERAFLREQLTMLDHHLTRLEDALDACGDCMEQEGLERMLHAARIERDVLSELLDELHGERALSLETAIMQRSQAARRTAARQSHNWRRGRPTPPGYWEAESRYTFLGRLLRNYHAWHAGRTTYAGTAAPAGDGAKAARPLPDPTHFGTVYSHPWYVAGGNGEQGNGNGNGKQNGQRSVSPVTPLDLEALREAVFEELAEIDLPTEHVDVIIQEDGLAIITGYAHSEEQREAALQAIIEIDDIDEELSDIKVVPAATCSACHPERAAQRRNGQAAS